MFTLIFITVYFIIYFWQNFNIEDLKGLIFGIIFTLLCMLWSEWRIDNVPHKPLSNKEFKIIQQLTVDL